MASEKKSPKAKSATARVISLLSPKDRRNLAVVLAVSLMSALIDVMGVGSIGPFLAVAAQPGLVETNPWLRGVYQWLGLTSTRDFLILLGIGVIAFVILTSAFKALTRYAVVRFTSNVRHRLSKKLMEGYLRQEYPYFLIRNSHELGKNVTGEIQLMVQGTLMTFVDMVGYALQLSLFVAFLLSVNPSTTLTIAVIVGLVYGTIYTALRSTVRRLGRTRFDLNRERSRVVAETFWGIKDTKLMGVEQAFLDQYEIPSQKLAKNESLAETVADVPKFALEAAAFSSILLFVLIIVIQTGSFQDAAVTVGLFAYAGYRLIPAMQNLFRALTKMRYSAPAAQKVFQEFEGLNNDAPSFRKAQSPVPFRSDLTLDKIGFTYAGTEKKVLDGLSLKIPRLNTVGFAGPTGSGKTTLIDIVLGLLQPQEGQITVDGVPIDRSNLRGWQTTIGYVPQTIYLFNASVAKNIAFGVPVDQIDIARVEKAARMAQIHDFIVGELAQGYDTPVGERGVRLSGGQRQRLGIARALYRQPEVLVFDEATSALDHETESAVMEAVTALSGQLTMLMIAHRLTTLKNCDQIYLLQAGRIQDQGTFEELSKRHRHFQETL